MCLCVLVYLCISMQLYTALMLGELSGSAEYSIWKKIPLWQPVLCFLNSYLMYQVTCWFYCTCCCPDWLILLLSYAHFANSGHSCCSLVCRLPSLLPGTLLVHRLLSCPLPTQTSVQTLTLQHITLWSPQRCCPVLETRWWNNPKSYNLVSVCSNVAQDPLGTSAHQSLQNALVKAKLPFRFWLSPRHLPLVSTITLWLHQEEGFTLIYRKAQIHHC